MPLLTIVSSTSAPYQVCRGSLALPFVLEFWCSVTDSLLNIRPKCNASETIQESWLRYSAFGREILNEIPDLGAAAGFL